MIQPHKTNTIHESDVRRVSKIGFRPSRSKSTNQNDIKECHEEICNGESYELCLINHLKSTLVLENEYTLQIQKLSMFRKCHQRNLVLEWICLVSIKYWDNEIQRPMLFF